MSAAMTVKNPFAAPDAVFVMGPTASGKSEFAFRLAKRFGGEIVSADSMQIYRGMDIGTAKEPPSRREAVPHSLIDVVAPDEEYSVARFRDEATAAGKKALAEGRLPIFVGGTGLYFESLFYPLSFGSAMKDPILRRELEEELSREGAEAMHRKLAAADAEAAAKLHPNDTKRVIRALEIALSGAAAHGAEMKTEAPDVIAVKFEPADRKVLYAAIDARVDEMIASGLAEEIAALAPDPAWQSMQAIGYKEFAPYLGRISDGKMPMTAEELAEVSELIKKHTRSATLTPPKDMSQSASKNAGGTTACEADKRTKRAEPNGRYVRTTRRVKTVCRKHKDDALRTCEAGMSDRRHTSSCAPSKANIAQTKVKFARARII